MTDLRRILVDAQTDIFLIDTEVRTPQGVRMATDAIETHGLVRPVEFSPARTREVDIGLAMFGVNGLSEHWDSSTFREPSPPERSLSVGRLQKKSSFVASNKNEVRSSGLVRMESRRFGPGHNEYDSLKLPPFEVLDVDGSKGLLPRVRIVLSAVPKQIEAIVCCVFPTAQEACIADAGFVLRKATLERTDDHYDGLHLMEGTELFRGAVSQCENFVCVAHEHDEESGNSKSNNDKKKKKKKKPERKSSIQEKDRGHVVPPAAALCAFLKVPKGSRSTDTVERPDKPESRSKGEKVADDAVSLISSCDSSCDDVHGHGAPESFEWVLFELREHITSSNSAHASIHNCLPHLRCLVRFLATPGLYPQIWSVWAPEGARQRTVRLRVHALRFHTVSSTCGDEELNFFVNPLVDILTSTNKRNKLFLLPQTTSAEGKSTPLHPVAQAEQRSTVTAEEKNFHGHLPIGTPITILKIPENTEFDYYLSLFDTIRVMIYDQKVMSYCNIRLCDESSLQVPRVARRPAPVEPRWRDLEGSACEVLVSLREVDEPLIPTAKKDKNEYSLCNVM